MVLPRTIVNEYVGPVVKNRRGSFSVEVTRELGYVLMTVYKNYTNGYQRFKVAQYRFRNETAARNWCIEHGYMREYVKRIWCPIHRVLHASVGGLTPISAFLDGDGKCLDRKVWTKRKAQIAKRRRFRQMISDLRKGGGSSIR